MPASSSDPVAIMLALASVPRLGPATLAHLVAVFGSPRAVWEAPAEALRLHAPRIAEPLVAARRQLSADALLEAATRTGCRVLAHGGPEYPPLLGATDTAPLVLFVRGSTQVLREPASVAIVGTRRASAYALRVTEKLVDGLSRAGVCIVSGMARGVDEAAHRRALWGGGATVAVLGCGADLCYPPESRSLKAAIERGGAVVSPFPPGTSPLPSHFPARNRVISGLSRAVVVVEAGVRSGALITADFALEHDRPLFAVPGSVLSEASAGCNRLLAEGLATVVRDADDVLRELGMRSPAPCGPAPVDDEAAELLGILGGDGGFTHEGWFDLEEIIARTGKAPTAVVRTLLRLELEGHVQRAAGNRYRAHGAQAAPSRAQPKSPSKP